MHNHLHQEIIPEFHICHPRTSCLCDIFAECSESDTKRNSREVSLIIIVSTTTASFLSTENRIDESGVSSFMSSYCLGHKNWKLVQY